MSDSQQRPTVGIIGIGAIGSKVAERLIESGYTLHICDVAQTQLGRFGELEAVVHPTPAQLASQSDLILSFLPNPQAVEEVAIDPENGILEGIGPQSIYCDMSTCPPLLAERLGRIFADRDRRFLDAPFSRQVPHMTVLVGGADGALGPYATVLKQFADNIVYCGDVGAGYAIKLLNQVIKYAWFMAAAESFALADNLGMGREVTVRALNMCSGAESGLSAAVEHFLGDERAIASHGPTRTLAKDLTLAEQMAADAGAQLPTIGPAARFFREAATTRYRDQPFGCSLALLRGKSHRHLDSVASESDQDHRTGVANDLPCEG